MLGLSLVKHSVAEIIQKIEIFHYEFELIGADIHSDKFIRIYLYRPREKHDRLGDLVIFQRGIFGIPKTVFIANNTSGAWHLVLFKYGEWCDYLLGLK
jgi:hypothetical protein